MFQSTEDETLATSTQRIDGSQDTGNDANDFNVGALQTDSTGVNANNAEPPALGSSLRINKVYAFPVGQDGVELFNPLNQVIDVSGWHISDGSIITPFSRELPQPVDFGGIYELRQGDADAFDFELEFDDVLYLYDENLVRLDQIGWTQFPTFFPDSCLQRTPDGVGPADGFDFLTSGGSIGLLVYDNCGLQGPVVVEVSPGPPGLVTNLASPYPNPSRGASTLEFVIGGAAGGRVSAEIQIYDVSGRLVRRLIQGEFEPGVYRAVWNGDRDSGARVGAGVYFARMAVDRQVVGKARPIVWLAP